jgi:hypothetical protein
MATMAPVYCATAETMKNDSGGRASKTRSVVDLCDEDKSVNRDLVE